MVDVECSLLDVQQVQGWPGQAAEHPTLNIHRPTSNSGFGFPERFLWNHY
jgi:hypothetical protein